MKKPEPFPFRGGSSGRKKAMPYSSSWDQFFFRGAFFLGSMTVPGAGRGIRFKRLILRCSFLESFLNSLSAALLILLMFFLLSFNFIMKDREEDVIQLRVENGGRPESLKEMPLRGERGKKK